jgi:hypothetical protein
MQPGRQNFDRRVNGSEIRVEQSPQRRPISGRAEDAGGRIAKTSGGADVAHLTLVGQDAPAEARLGERRRNLVNEHRERRIVGRAASGEFSSNPAIHFDGPDHCMHLGR